MQRKLVAGTIVGARGVSIIGRADGKRLFQVAIQSGYTGEEEVFTFFSQPDWVVMLPITHTGHVIVGRQFKQGVALVASVTGGLRSQIADDLENPNELEYLRGGLIDELSVGTKLTGKGSTPKEVMTDRLLAETGFQAKEVMELGHPMFPVTRSSPTRFRMFLGLDCEKVAEQRDDPKEVVEVREVPLIEWIRMCLDGSVVEPSAVCATSLSVSHLLKRGILDPRDYLAVLEACADAR